MIEECPHCKFINDLFQKCDNNKEYWLMTEVFVYLHNGKDYCEFNEKEII